VQVLHRLVHKQRNLSSKDDGTVSAAVMQVMMSW
jgi:hypothetical protein